MCFIFVVGGILECFTCTTSFDFFEVLCGCWVITSCIISHIVMVAANVMYLVSYHIGWLGAFINSVLVYSVKIFIKPKD
ncbi:hypothetical protein QVD17_07151 [Tagetes erecta]|uniref:Uncharacterized protein n=1 Tax=Tagetes erecta TaxID=13708 RepID=A0AAD8PCG1_TARER|nr:hypothetical protein QVD17_07151 [Tagetes erecta]